MVARAMAHMTSDPTGCCQDGWVEFPVERSVLVHHDDPVDTSHQLEKRVIKLSVTKYYRNPKNRPTLENKPTPLF